MNILVSSSKREAGQAAGQKAGALIKAALERRKRARLVAATGASQLEMLEELSSIPGIDWSRTELFHLDEYIGLDENHPASFRKYLNERLVSKTHIPLVHFINGNAADLPGEIARLSRQIEDAPIDVLLLGIGENGHLAFNDPPADFDSDRPFIIVSPDRAARQQQVGEGWFGDLDEVPMRAISMSIRQIMKAEAIVCTVPDLRKARAVRDCLSATATVSNKHPASILKLHKNAFVFLDNESASLL